MALLMYAACDGGGLNTLAGAGGILEIEIEPRRQMRYFEFPSGLGGSTHMVAATPDKRALIASSANIGQIFVIPRSGDRYDLPSFRTIDTFNSLGTPRLGTDAQTAMFDFLDNEHIACQYNRKLLRVNIETGKLEVLADFAERLPERADLLHQVSVTDRWIVVDEVVKGGIFIYDRQSGEVDFMGDGFPGGHHVIHRNDAGETIVIRPAFGFQSLDAHLKIDDNSLSFYNLDKKTASTRCYSWEIPNHDPTDIHIEDGFLYVSFAIPGSVAKIEMATGAVAARHNARPWIFTRYWSMLMDSLYYLLDYGTMRNRHDTAEFTLPLFAHAFALGRAAGTRGGYFAMGTKPGIEELYVCHRGLNRVFCLRKSDLRVLWSRRLPSRRSYAKSPMKGFFYNRYRYFNRCLGVHHGTLVET